jgi:hypothetical protein
MTSKYAGTIAYMRDAARALEAAAADLERGQGYALERAGACLRQVAREVDLCSRHVLRGLERRHARLLDGDA